MIHLSFDTVLYLIRTRLVRLTSQRKGFSPECWSEWTFKDMLRLNDFPHVSQVNGMSFVWAGERQGRKGEREEGTEDNNIETAHTWSDD